MGFAFAKALKATEGLKRDIKRFLDGVEESMGEAQKRLASEAARRLVAYSPVWTADYVKSFRVGIGTDDPSFTLTHSGLPPFPYQLTESEAEIEKQAALSSMLMKVSSTKLFEKIILSNNIPYAIEVEYIGWERSEPYHVFSKTISDMTMIASNLNNFMKANQ